MWHTGCRGAATRQSSTRRTPQASSFFMPEHDDLILAGVDYVLPLDPWLPSGSMTLSCGGAITARSC